MLKVKRLELEARLKSVPDVPVASAIAGPVAALIEVIAAESLAFHVAAEAMRPSARVPVQPAIKFKVLAVEVETLIKILVSLVVAT